MKAIAYTHHALPLDDPRSLDLHELPAPAPGPRDLLVAVRAVAVNPVDTKVRAFFPTEGARILGWDAVGTVEQVGSDVTLFKPGDTVYYAGSLTRPGNHAEYSVVDERIAGHKPASLSDAEAAALPLTSLTAWELLFDRLGVPENGGAGQTLLVVGAAGGVGSILVQLARRLTGLTVIGTASREDTRDWVQQLGAHHVIDHRKPLTEELARIDINQVQYVASLTHTERHYAQLVQALAPQGRLALIDDPESLDAMPLKRKSASLHWEFMFTRPMFETDDMQRQHDILERVAGLVDSGVLRTTMGEHYGKIDVANMRRAHARLESGLARGKIVMEGF